MLGGATWIESSVHAHAGKRALNPALMRSTQESLNIQQARRAFSQNSTLELSGVALSTLLSSQATASERTTGDAQATNLFLHGLDHQRLTYRFQGRDFRLSDVHGEVVDGILA